MKSIVLYCPSCGARLDVDVENKTADCQYCGAHLPIEDETQRFRVDGAQQAGYDSETGRLRAQEDEKRRREMAAFEEQQRREAEQRARVAAQVQAVKGSQKKKQTLLLWVLGWLFFWPAPLSVLIYRAFRKGGLKKGTSCAAVAALWGASFVILLVIAVAYGTSDAYKSANSNSDDVAAQESNEKKAEDDYAPAMKTFIEKYNAASHTPLSDIEKIDENRFRCEASGRTIDVDYSDDGSSYAVYIVMDKSLGTSWIKYVVHDFAEAFDSTSADALEEAWLNAAVTEYTATEDLEKQIGAMKLSVNYGNHIDGIESVSIRWADPNATS